MIFRHHITTLQGLFLTSKRRIQRLMPPKQIPGSLLFGCLSSASKHASLATLMLWCSAGIQLAYSQANDGEGLRSVEAEGMAAGDGGNARAEALTAALREAVRVGVGVNVVEQSQVSDFQLDFDRVFAQSFGYVRNYKVLSTNLGEDGIYRVRIRAEVAPGNPADNDRMTFKMLAKARQSPRLLIQLEEEINGSTGSTTASDWYGNLAKELGVQVAYAQDPGKSMATRRSEILNRTTEAALRQAGAVSNHDYVLEGKVIARSAEPQTIAGTLRRMCSVAVELRVVDPVAGQVVVSDVMEARRFALEASLDPVVACREAIRRALSEPASAEETGEPGMKSMRMLFCHWIAEMDLGAVYRIEIGGLKLETAEKLKDDLSGRDKVGAVWVRSIDPVGISVIDVESRLEGLELAKVLCSAAGDAFTLDRSDNRYLSLIRSEENKSKNTSEEKSDTPADPPPTAGFPMQPVAGGAGGLLLLGILGFLGKRFLSAKNQSNP
jgi:hypothetical protein